MNKWLIIIIILFICFIVIPVSLKLLNIKEGLTTNVIGNKVNATNSKIQTPQNSLASAKPTSTPSASPTSTSTPAASPTSTSTPAASPTSTSTSTASPTPTASPITTSTPITTASPITTSTPITTVSPITTASPITTLTPSASGKLSNNLQMGEFNTKMDKMNENINAYNTTNLSNTGAIQTMDKTIQSTNATYLKKLDDINFNILQNNQQTGNVDYDAINKKINNYNKEQLKLTKLILSNIDAYKVEDDIFKTDVRKRLLMK